MLRHRSETKKMAKYKEEYVHMPSKCMKYYEVNREQLPSAEELPYTQIQQHTYHLLVFMYIAHDSLDMW